MDTYPPQECGGDGENRGGIPPPEGTAKVAWSMNRLSGLVGLMAISGSPDENPVGLWVICTWMALLGGTALAD
jgi:hypothetical protein